MHYIMSEFLSNYSSADIGFILLRITVGIIFLYHGIKKFPMWKTKPSDQMKLSMLLLLRLAFLMECIGGIAMVSGYYVEFAALGFIGVMLGALYFKLFMWKAPFSGNNGWELDLILLAASIALFMNGDLAFMLIGQ